MIDYGKIVTEESRDGLLTEFGKTTMRRQHCLPGETYQQAFARPSQAFSAGDEALAQRLYDRASRLHFSFATPVIANGGTDRGLPISCFLNYVHDSVRGLAENFVENAFLSTNGGGIGTYWGHVRSVGEKTSRGVETPGMIPFMHVQDSQTLAYHQGSTRRGAAAVYADVSHPEIMEFIKVRQSTGGGDVHRKSENLHHGVVITDAFMNAVEKNGPWNLVDPHSGTVKQTLNARDIWIAILQQRARLGEPFMFFVDAARRAMPKSQRDLGLNIWHTNLCTEITLPTGPDRTAVCCLSSLNLDTLDEWWDDRESFIDDIVTMLDNVLDVFIERAPPEMWRAVASARAERALGLGTLGFVSYFQGKMLPLSSPEVAERNKEIYAEIQRCAIKASRRLAQERGEPDDMKGTGLRHSNLIAVAPNATSSIVCGTVSPSTEGYAANAFTQKTMSGSHMVKNKALIPVLQRYGRDNEETWSSIAVNDGSVQHLDFLSDLEKEVFLTASEADPMVTIDLAIGRNPFICQAQSVNLFFPPTVSASVLHRVHMAAWKGGLKSLYYVRKSSVGSTGTGMKSNVIPVSFKGERQLRSADGGVTVNLDRQTVSFEPSFPGESECVACEA